MFETIIAKITKTVRNIVNAVGTSNAQVAMARAGGDPRVLPRSLIGAIMSANDNQPTLEFLDEKGPCLARNLLGHGDEVAREGERAAVHQGRPTHPLSAQRHRGVATHEHHRRYGGVS